MEKKKETNRKPRNYLDIEKKKLTPGTLNTFIVLILWPYINYILG